MIENANPKSQSAVLPYAWVILVVVFLASVAAPLNQAKIPPLMPVIMDSFQITLGQAGWLMSVFALTGLFLSLPAGIFLQKFGPKILGLIALGCLVLGSAMGALSHNPSLLLFSRVIEGSGMGLIAVIAPAVIAMWFPPEKQGIPIGIWATWVPMGTLAVYSLAPGMSAAFGWQSVWWLGAIFALLILLIYALLIRLPPWMEESTHRGVETSIMAEFRASLSALNNRSIWLLGLVFGCFTLVFMGMGTYYPTFLAETCGYSLSQAAYISSIATIMVLFSAPLAGWLSDRIGSRRMMFSIPFLILAVMMFFPFKISGWQIFAYMMLQGSFAGAVPTATFAAAPEVMKKPELAGLGLAVVMFGQNLGFFVGPILFGKLVESLGWVYAGYCLIPFCLLGFLIGWKLNIR
ncbi:MAG: MFS transporter [Anaerolineales bacterium]